MNNTNNPTTLTSFIWQVADDILRDIYVKGKYRDVILPMVVLVRIDSELVETKEKTLIEYSKYKDKIKNIQPILERCTGYNFYRTKLGLNKLKNGILAKTGFIRDGILTP